MPEAAVQFADRVLIYVPGVGHDRMNSADVIAKSIARSVDRETHGAVATTEKTPPAPPGCKSVCTIVTANGAEERLLDVVEFDYRERMKAIGTSDGKEAAPRGPLHAAAIALLAGGFLLGALRRPSKSRRAKIQLTFGLSACLVLVLWAAYLLASAILTLVTSATGTELGGFLGALFTPDSTKVLLGGLTAAGYIAFRDAIIRESNKIAQMIDYHTRPDCAKDLADSLGTAIDAIRDQHPDREIHLLAYSFGSVLLLDTVIPADGDVPTRRGSFVNSIQSMTTVGCPIDFARLFLPRYFTGRRALRPADQQGNPISWSNVFIASDLFGSNFAVDPPSPDSATSGADRTVPKAPSKGARSDEMSGLFGGPAGMPVRSFRYLPQETLTRFGWVRQTALRQHARYWGVNGGCWNFVLDQWIPRLGSQIRASGSTPAVELQGPADLAA